MAEPVKNESPIRAILRRAPVIPVYGPAGVEEAVRVGEALLRGGLPVIEVTLRTPVAIEALAAIVKALPDAIVGAFGTRHGIAAGHMGCGAATLDRRLGFAGIVHAA